MINSYERINQLVVTSENLRKKYSSDLQIAISANEDLQNQIFGKD